MDYLRKGVFLSVSWFISSVIGRRGDGFGYTFFLSEQVLIGVVSPDVTVLAEFSH